ncbi:MAG TPA: PD-(D/E)XK nuclease family protein [Dissulfurispiraceae bacterium]
MVKVFYAPLDFRGTTRFLFTRAVLHSRHPDYSNILCLAPTPVKADNAQKTFYELQSRRCYIPPEISTIRGYSKRLYSSCGDKRALQGSLVPVILSRLAGKGLGFSAITADFISGLKQRYPGIALDEIRAAFRRIFEDSNLPESVRDVISGALDTFGHYQCFLLEHGLADEDDMLNTAPACIPECIKEGASSLILDGFYSLTATETRIVGELIRNFAHTYIAVPYDPDFYGVIKDYIGFLKGNFTVEEVHLNNSDELSPPFSYCSYADAEEEVEGIARNIKSLCVAGKVKRLEEVAVVFPDLNVYAAMVARVFRRYGIPCELSLPQGLAGMRPFLDLFCLLDSVAEGYPRLKFSQFLSSHYFSRLPATLKKWIPSLSLSSGIVSGKASWLAFISEGSELLDIGLVPERETIEKDLQKVFRRLEPLEYIRGGASFGVFADTVKEILDALGFPGSISAETPPGDAQDAKLTERILEAFAEVLERLAFLGDLTPAPVTMAEFIEVLKHMLHFACLEHEGTGVRVMGFRDAQGLSPEYLYFGGLSDENMPGRPDIDYLLPDGVKMKMGLLHLEKYDELQKFAYQSVTKSCAHMHLSYPLMEGEKVFLPSSFLYSGEEVKESLPGIFSGEEELIRSGEGSLLGHIEEIGIPRSLLHMPSSLRVTAIDAYRSCPRKYFIEERMRLAPMGVKEYEVEAATIGTIIHRVMERLMKEPFGELGELKQKAGRIAEEAVKDRKMDAYWKTLIRDTFVEILPGIYDKELEIRGEGYVSTEVEKSVSGEPLKGIKLKGKIDRIDKIGDEVQIIDYKTGAAGLNCTQALSGNENLQLFLYAAILKSHGYRVTRVGIYSLKDLNIKWCPPKKRGRKGKDAGGQEIDAYIAASLMFLGQAVERMKEGDFSANPLNEYACWNCHEYAFCPYIQQ